MYQMYHWLFCVFFNILCSVLTLTVFVITMRGIACLLHGLFFWGFVFSWLLLFRETFIPRWPTCMSIIYIHLNILFCISFCAHPKRNCCVVWWIKWISQFTFLVTCDYNVRIICNCVNHISRWQPSFVWLLFVNGGWIISWNLNFHGFIYCMHLLLLVMFCLYSVLQISNSCLAGGISSLMI